MAAILTGGAIMTLCGDDSSSEDLKAVIQVIDMKLVQSQHQISTEKYRLVLSDGSHYQQGMLGPQINELVHSGRLQKDSVVKLTHFICNVVHGRKIIIIIGLEVVLEKCDLIGEPVRAPRSTPAQPATGQSGVTFGNSQSLDSSSHAGGGGITARSNVAGPSIDHPKMNHPASSVYAGNADSAIYGGSNAPPTYLMLEQILQSIRSVSAQVLTIQRHLGLVPPAFVPLADDQYDQSDGIIHLRL